MTSRLNREKQISSALTLPSGKFVVVVLRAPTVFMSVKAYFPSLDFVTKKLSLVLS